MVERPAMVEIGEIQLELKLKGDNSRKMDQSCEIRCPRCGERLLRVGGFCKGLLMTCPKCQASVKVNADATGDMQVSVKVKPKKSAIYNKI